MSILMSPPKIVFPPEPTKQKNSSNQIDINLVQQTLAVFRDRADKQRIVTKPFFKDFDKHNDGTVTSDQFARILTLLGFNPAASALSALQAYYAVANDSSRVNYKNFLADLDPHSVNMSVTSPKLAETLSKTFSVTKSNPLNKKVEEDPYNRIVIAPVTFDGVIRKIQTFVQQKRLIINDIFSDYDPLRRHKITITQFRRSMDLAGFNLSENEFNVLIDHFYDQEDPNYYKYSEFVLTVNSAFIPDQAEKFPTMELKKFTPWRVEESISCKFTEPEKQRIDDLLKQIGHVSYTRRILIKPSFKRYDKAAHGTVTQRQFQSVMSSLFPINFTQYDLSLLCDLYRKGEEGINYVYFCNDVTSEENRIHEAAIKSLEPINLSNTLSSPSNNLSSTQPSEDITSILASLRAYILNNRITFDDCFKDFDRLHKGRVTREQFSRSLTLRRIYLSPSESAILYKHYAAPQENTSVIVGPSTNLHVDYVSFIRDLDIQQ